MVGGNRVGGLGSRWRSCTRKFARAAVEEARENCGARVAMRARKNGRPFWSGEGRPTARRGDFARFGRSPAACRSADRLSNSTDHHQQHYYTVPVGMDSQSSSSPTAATTEARDHCGVRPRMIDALAKERATPTTTA
uniref:Uncharacterized protein n=1 Tax=Plectus sambesii TaxID=2011161 RepID=A0A914VIG9_9BILA